MKADLSQLKDIHLPDPVSWWPPAPGWWGLLVLLIILSGISVWLYRRYQSNRWRTDALAECQHIKTFLSDAAAPSFTHHHAAQQISALLRRVAITRFPRNEVASLSDQDWIDFLARAVNHKTELDAETAELLLYAPYRPHAENNNEHNIMSLLNFTERWIKALPAKNQARINHPDHYQAEIDQRSSTA